MFNFIKNTIKLNKATSRLSDNDNNYNNNYVWIAYTHGSLFADKWTTKKIQLPSCIPVQKSLIVKPKHVKQTIAKMSLVVGIIATAIKANKN